MENIIVNAVHLRNPYELSLGKEEKMSEIISKMIENVVIIGAGCAGLTAAVYAARADLKPLVIAGPMPGGLITTTGVVENFAGFPEGVEGFDLVSKIQAQAERFGARIEYGNVESIDLSMKPFELKVDGASLRSLSIIIATGAGHRHLGLDSEVQLEKKGVTYCATCDGALPIFRNQPLVVVGGGDSACEEALHLTHFGSEVYLIHRRDTLRASKIMAERVLNHPKIKPVWDSVVVDILDVAQNKVTGVRLRNVKTNAERTLSCAGVFIAIGHVPNTALFEGQLEMDEAGYILRKNGTSATSIPGVFVAGDCTDSRYRQSITAAGLGAGAAIDAGRWIGEMAATDLK